MLRALFLALLLMLQPAAAETLDILAFGDSLTAGLGLEPSQAFPAKLEEALKARGHDVRVLNAGVSGDTSAAALERLDWAVTDELDAVVVCLGGNDALRGLDPGETERSLDAILTRLRQRRLPVLLAGMRAPRNLGPDYAAAFDAVFPTLANRHGVGFYPFFLEGVAADPALNQPDGIHPSAKGVEQIVNAILPKVEELIGQIDSK